MGASAGTGRRAAGLRAELDPHPRRPRQQMTIPRLSALELQQIPKPFDHAEWVFEIKYDGFRSLAQIENGVCRLISRRNNVFKRFDDLRRALPADMKSDEVVLDGEIVVLDDEGKSLFNELMHTRNTPIFAA